MPHDFTDLIADLDAAKADLARTVKRCRTRAGERRRAPSLMEEPEADRSVFDWPDAKAQ